MTEPHPGPVAILPWGYVFEDFLDTIGVSIDEFAEQMTGGWLFGYVEALRRAGVESVIVCFSRDAAGFAELRHAETGATISVLPASRAYLALRARLRNPYGWNRREALGEARGLRFVSGLAARELAPYLATPLRALGRELRRLGASALLVQEYESPRFDACVLLGSLLGLPAFATFQGGDAQVTTLERLARPLALRACDGVIIGPLLEAERVRKRYGLSPEKIASIPNPLDLELWQPSSREEGRAELGIAPTARVVAWHGRVEIHRKGIDVLLDGWRALRDLRPDDELHLLLVGSGSDSDELRRRLDAEVFADVTWVDDYVLDRDRIRRALSASDLYAFPSRIEGFPVAPLEAMATGLPVVAAASPGVRQILKEGPESGGIVVSQESPGELATELARLLADDSARAELGRRARRRAEAFSLDAVGPELREFFRRRGARL